MIQPLREWFTSQKRDLPWRKNQNPYAVFVSEIMLQQTQVSVVIPYFLRWMEEFPTFEALASSEEEKVLKCWEGLGYYSRAKNLRKAAIFICQHWGGKMPERKDELAKIPGIGPYTSGAIQAFAFHKKAAAVDGNVMRVLSRYFAIEDDISKSKSQDRFRALAEALLPENEPWIIAEAWIELGALVCRKKPLCLECPLKKTCKAFQNDLTDKLPVKSAKQPTTYLHRMVPLLRHHGQILIRRVPEGEIMAGLHEFPYFEEKMELGMLQEKVRELWNLDTTPIRKLPPVQHGFTRYRATLVAYLFQCDAPHTPKGYFWVPLEEISKLAFSSGHRKLLQFAS